MRHHVSTWGRDGAHQRVDEGGGGDEEKGRLMEKGTGEARRRAGAWDCARDMPSFLSVMARHRFQWILDIVL